MSKTRMHIDDPMKMPIQDAIGQAVPQEPSDQESSLQSWCPAAQKIRKERRRDKLGQVQQPQDDTSQVSGRQIIVMRPKCVLCGLGIFPGGVVYCDECPGPYHAACLRWHLENGDCTRFGRRLKDRVLQNAGVINRTHNQLLGLVRNSV